MAGDEPKQVCIYFNLFIFLLIVYYLEERSPVKRKAIVSYVDKKKCDVNNGKRGITDRQLCAGQGDGVDSCYGDSGGPLMLETRTKNNSYATFIVGLVSYGYGRLCGNFPGVYTYLPPYLDWIEQQLT